MMPHKDPAARKAYLAEYAKKNPAYARVKAWREKNKAKKLEQDKRYADAHQDLIAAKYQRYKENNLEKVLERDRVAKSRYRAENPEKVAKSKKTYAQNNKHKINASVAKRKAAKLQQTPVWLTEDDLWMIDQAYELAVLRTNLFGFMWHVDHIVPLQGKTASGLHVPQNIRVIPWIENLKKGNRMEAEHA